MLTRIALIHATPVAMPPVMDAFAHGWPEVETVNLLDDALSRDLARTGAPQLAHCDVIMLAQFSMARAQAAVQQVVDPPVLTSPASAVAKLKAALS